MHINNKYTRRTKINLSRGGGQQKIIEIKDQSVLCTSKSNLMAILKIDANFQNNLESGSTGCPTKHDSW